MIAFVGDFTVVGFFTVPSKLSTHRVARAWIKQNVHVFFVLVLSLQNMRYEEDELKCPPFQLTHILLIHWECTMYTEETISSSPA